jgi:DNA-directed RNA polymerase specialized sigma24 family protein
VNVSTNEAKDVYADLLRWARRVSTSDDEALDLVQDSLLIALDQGHQQWAAPDVRGWLHGVVGKRAAFLARTEVRRRRREQATQEPSSDAAARWAWRTDFLESLPPSLRVVARLASADLCAKEIEWLLELNNTALRQRLTALRRAVLAETESPTRPVSGAPLTFGATRAQLLNSLRRQPGRVLATHDPDGHPLLFRVVPHKTKAPGNL